VTDFILLTLPSPEGDRFAILPKERLIVDASRFWIEADRVGELERVFSGLDWLSEADARASLAAQGLSPAAIDERLAQARRAHAVVTSAPTTIERITRVGYRNPDGQEVTHKTERAGPDGQRIYLLRCTVCGHAYGAYGCDIDIRRCPQCQDGPPGVTLK